MTLPVYLSDSYEMSVRWSVGDDGVLIASVLTPYMLTGTAQHEDEDREEHRVPDAELEAIHPHLPLIVRALIDWYRDTYTLQWGPGDEVIANMNYLTRPSYQVRDSFNRLLLLTNIFAITIDERTGGAALVCDSIKVEHLDYRGHDLPVVVESFRGASVIKKEELDEKFPGWLSRYNMAIALGLDDKEVAPYVLDKAFLASPKMEDINFDHDA